MGNTLGQRTITQRGKMVVGGLIASGVVAGGIFLNQLSTDGSEKKGDQYAAFLPIVFDVSGTGSNSAANVQRYDAACIENPLANLDLGSGSVVRLTYHNISNPAGASGDIGFVKSCNDHTASGSSLVDNFCTGTKCTTKYTTGTADWNGADFIKVTHSKNPTTSYDAKVTVWVEDILGE